MKKNININFCNINMIKHLSFLMIFFISILTVNANSNLLQWKFEEGSGSITLDSSGNSNHGVISENNKFRNGDCAYGLYCLDFDGNNDFVISLTESAIPEILTININSYREDKSGLNNIFMLGDILRDHFKFRYDDTLQEYSLEYLDNTSTARTITLESILEININQIWQSLTITLNYNDNSIKFWREGNLIYNQTQAFTFYPTDNDNKLRLGGDFALLNDYKGWYDNVNMFDFELNSSQITLIETNGVLLNDELGNQDEGNGNGGGDGNVTGTNPLINGTQEFNLINSYTPGNGATVNSIFNIDVSLNNQASCDIYIDNNYYKTVNDVLAFSETINNLEGGVHEYFIYCSTIDTNNFLLYDLTNTTTITVLEPNPSTINFIYSSSELSVVSTPLFMVTPCLKEGIVIPGTGRSKYSRVNNGDTYFDPVVNGVSTFNLSSGDHEFCLVHGVAQYNQENTFSDIWFVNQATHQEKIGTFSVPSNVTQNFYLEIDNSDIYGVADPKWWGTSWVAIIGSLLAFILGVALAWAGIEFKSPQAIVMGALLIMLALGYQVSNLVLGVLL